MNEYMNKKLRFIGSSLVCLALVFNYWGCKKDDNNSTAGTACDGIVAADNKYSNTIKPILNASCAYAGCHDAITKAENLDLSSYVASKSAFQNSKMICSINHASGCTPMPKNAGKLSADIIKKLECWANSSYPE